MKYNNILITGGAGFVGSNLALKLKTANPATEIIAFDNLKRRGSELNVPRLCEAGVIFIHGDVRHKEDLNLPFEIDLIIECSAEPSVLAGVDGSTDYVIDTNLVGAINCFELARVRRAAVIFLSTSRVYPMGLISQLAYKENLLRFVLEKKQIMPGASEQGISEIFSLQGPRSLYGATKLAAELLLIEYIESFGITGVINRCGLITGPWQMGKVDQGVVALWVARHLFGGKPLSYIGFGGTGKQVRDFVHIDDLYSALVLQLQDIAIHNGEIYNIGGGMENSFSLQELTATCQQITGKMVAINSISENRPNDIPLYISDCAKFKQATGWKCRKNITETVQDLANWMRDNAKELKNLFL